MNNFIRKFLLCALIATSLACLGFTSPGYAKQIESSFISSHIAAGGLWADWDELTQAGFDTDQDGDGTDDTFIVMFDAGGAGANDTGVGVASGVSLVFTQSGNVAGATGTPPRRVMDGGDDFFTLTETVANVMAGSNTFTAILKFGSVAQENSAASLYIFDDATNHLYMNQRGDGSGTINFICEMNNNVMWDAFTTTSINAGDTNYLVAWSDGTNVRGGLKVGSKPIKWSDFGATDRFTNTFAAQFNSFAGATLLLASNGTTIAAGNLYYFIVSNKNLIGAN